jgi:hypothetical protein
MLAGMTAVPVWLGRLQIMGTDSIRPASLAAMLVSMLIGMAGGMVIGVALLGCAPYCRTQFRKLTHEFLRLK